MGGVNVELDELEDPDELPLLWPIAARPCATSRSRIISKGPRTHRDFPDCRLKKANMLIVILDATLQAGT